MATAPKRTTRSTRGTRSKADIQAELDAIRVEIRNNEGLTASELLLHAQRNDAIRAATQGVSVETALKNITDLGLVVQKALAGVSEQLTGEVKQLEELRAAIALEQKELERLYQIDIATASIENLVAEYEQKKKELEQEGAEREAELNERLELLREEFDTTRAEAEKARARDEEEYAYRVKLRRGVEEDAYQQQRLLRERGLEEAEALRLKALAEKEALLKVREAQQTDLEKQVADMPAMIAKAEKTAEAITSNRLTKDFDHKAALAKMEADSASKIAQQQIESLRATIESQTLGLTTLRAELAAANARAENIAAKALDASSGQQALAVAMQTQSNRDNGVAGGKRA